MQGTFQDAQGNSYVGGNMVTPQEYASHMSIMNSIAAQSEGQRQVQTPGLVPTHPATIDQQNTLDQQSTLGATGQALAARQNEWRNPITAGLKGLGNLVGW